VSIGKVSNKKLSHNLKTRKAPLRVLPMTTFHIRHQVKKKNNESIKKQDMEETKHTPLPPPPLQCTLEKVARTTGKRIKKSARKGPMTIRPFMNFNFTMNALRWICLLIFVYLAAGIFIVMIQDGTESLKNIVIYSIIGFFTFFMGYLGWILARDVLEIALGKTAPQNEV
jgi:hypothetical protein